MLKYQTRMVRNNSIDSFTNSLPAVETPVLCSYSHLVVLGAQILLNIATVRRKYLLYRKQEIMFCSEKACLSIPAQVVECTCFAFIKPTLNAPSFVKYEHNALLRHRQSLSSVPRFGECRNESASMFYE